MLNYVLLFLHTLSASLMRKEQSEWEVVDTSNSSINCDSIIVLDVQFIW